jgi:hypothetical protein
MLNIQILTHNNEPTIRKTIESLLPLDAQITVGDLGSADNTVAVSESLGAIVEHLGGVDRATARNKLAKPGLNLAVEPWEVLAQGKCQAIESCAYVTVINRRIITKEARIWEFGTPHENPTFEVPVCDPQAESDIVLYVIGRRDFTYDRQMLAKWKREHPTAAQPFYYQSCIELAESNFDEFMRNAEHYLFLDRSRSMTATMSRYYLAMTYMMRRRQARPALQNINLCLCARPLMAEFWCLMADVYYHLLKKFTTAMEFYENAIILGSRRLRSDKWPMDISKYKDYPSRMIESCQKLSTKHAFYASRFPLNDSQPR